MTQKYNNRNILSVFGSLITTAALLHGEGLKAAHMSYTFVSLAFFFVYRWYLKKVQNISFPKICLIPAAVFAVFSVSAHRFLDQMVSGSARQCLCFLGFFCFYAVLSHLFFLFLDQKDSLFLGYPRLKQIGDRFCRHPFRNSFLLCCLCWVFPVVVKYPIAFNPDTERQLLQGLGVLPLNSMHPVFHTMLLTGFYKIGAFFGSSDLGLFSYSILQALLFAAVIGYGICFLLRLRVPQWAVMGTIVYFCTSPFIWGYVGETLKDAPFAIFVLFFVILVAESTLLTKEFWNTWYRPALLLFAATSLVLLRHNGTYMLLSAGLVMLLLLWRSKSQDRLRRIAVVLLVLLLPLGASKAVNIIFDAGPGSLAESLSMPFQQTARFVKYHEDLITEEEREIIDKILPYDRLAEAYNPYLSDPVKFSYKSESTSQDLMDYFRVWLSQFFRAPGCYWDAIMEQNTILLYPGYNNYKYDYFYDYLEGYVETPPGLRPLQEKFLNFTISLHELPILFLVNNMAVYNMLFLLLVFYALHKQNWHHMAYLLPILITLIGILAAPCIQYHVRYVFPVLYPFPIMLACALSEQNTLMSARDGMAGPEGSQR